MAIIKEKRITVESVIEDLDASGLSDTAEKCRNEYDAFLKITDGELVISYCEMNEGGRTVTDLTVTEECITVSRRGGIESDFRFSEGRVERSLYKMPPYEFDAEISTVKIRNNLTRVGGDLLIFYDMTLGGAKRRVRMKVSVPRDGA